MSRTIYQEWGMRCPECYHDEALTIVAKIAVRLGAQGSEVDLDSEEWNDDSPAYCKACGWMGTVGDAGRGLPDPFDPADRRCPTCNTSYGEPIRKNPAGGPVAWQCSNDVCLDREVRDKDE